MKKIIQLTLLLLVFIHADAQLVKQHGQLRVQGTRLVNEKGDSIALHGMSFGWHNLWPRFYNAGAVKELVENWNCTVIRASMGIELNDRGYLKDSINSINLMKKVIDACLEQGVYVIIDWHDHNIHLKEAVSFFDRMSKEYGQHPHIIYEVFNEPDYETWQEVKAYSEEVIKAIRSNDPDNIIIVGSPRWDQDVHLPAADPIRGYDNLMYSMHFYAGTHKSWLRERTDAAIRQGLPIIISECAGMEATGDGPIDHSEWISFIDWMDRSGLSWIAWSVSDKNETCSVLYPAAESSGNWKDSEIKDWGKLVKACLKKYQ